MASDFSARPRRIETSALIPTWMKECIPVALNIEVESRPLSLFHFDEQIERNLKKMGVSTLFPVQCAVIPHIANCSGPLLLPSNGTIPRDVCVASPTGSGKTLAYVIPVVAVLARHPSSSSRALVVAPSQNLVDQIAEVFYKVSKGTSVSVSVLSSQVRNHTSVLLCTPGALTDQLAADQSFLAQIRFLVFDEVDRLVGFQFKDWIDELSQCLEARKGVSPKSLKSIVSELMPSPTSYLFKRTMQSYSATLEIATPSTERPTSRQAETAEELLTDYIPVQKLLFSATLKESPEMLACLNLHKPLLFSAEATDSSPERKRQTVLLPQTLEENLIVCSAEDKPLMVLHLLINKRFCRVLCFTGSKEATERLAMLLSYFDDKLVVRTFTAKQSRGKRSEIVHQFNAGKVDIIVCSDSMARGMDLLKVYTDIYNGHV